MSFIAYAQGSLTLSTVPKWCLFMEVFKPVCGSHVRTIRWLGNRWSFWILQADHKQGGVGWRVATVKVSNDCNVWSDVKNPSFESLEHFHVEFGDEGYTIWHKLTAKLPPNIEEHSVGYWPAHSDLEVRGCRGVPLEHFPFSGSYLITQNSSLVMTLFEK